MDQVRVCRPRAAAPPGEDPSPEVANCLVLTKVDADPAPSAEESTAQGQ